jgi:OFA family oxalate/formate antiporter-like MFS transporter
VKRYVALIAAVLMLAFMGTNQAFSVFDRPLRETYGLRSSQTQAIFGTATLVFCIFLIVAGRLHDRVGPRPLAIASAALMGAGMFLAWRSGGSFGLLWLSQGVIVAAGTAAGYVCPIATAVKWFPHHKGLIAGLAAAGFAGGPILLSGAAEALFARGWGVLDIYGFVGAVYAPVLLVTGLLLVTPGPVNPAHVAAFRRRELLRDRRFWMLWVGMLCGTFPYLIVIGKVKPMGEAFGIGPAAAVFAVTAACAGNAFGRLFWGYVVDRLGHRRAMLASQALMPAVVLAMIGSSVAPALFLVAAAGVGFCYGSNFAIYPATVANFYGPHVLGSVYPLIMFAQGVSSVGPPVAGWLYDVTDSYLPGLAIAAAVAAAGLMACTWLGRSGAPAALHRSAP